MIRIRLTLAALALSVFAFGTASMTRASAPQTTPYSTASLAALQAQNRPILVDVAAWWCPVCASQNRTIRRLIALPAYRNLAILHLDYDRQKTEWRALGATRQATLIAYRGRTERGRIAFETDPAKIEALLSAAVK